MSKVANYGLIIITTTEGLPRDIYMNFYIGNNSRSRNNNNVKHM